MIALDNGNGKVRKVDMATRAVTTLLTGMDNSMSCTFAQNSGGASFYIVRQKWHGFMVRWASLVMALASPLVAPVTSRADADVRCMCLCIRIHVPQGVMKVDSSSGATTVIAGANVQARTDGVGAAAHFERPYGIAITPDSTTAYIVTYGTQSLRKINLATNQVTTVLSGTLKQFACSVAITPDGTTLIVGTCGTANLQAIDLTTGSYGQTTFASINVEIDSASLAITPDGSTIFVCDHGAPKIHMVV